MATKLGKIYLITNLLMAFKAMATIYIPTPLEDQVKESYGIVRGNYQGQVYKKNSKGDVITEISISLKETSGLKPGDIINKNNFKVAFPGGVWQGIRHKYSGSPKFVEGEDVVLLIFKGSNGFHLLNFGLGKYSVQREAGTYFLNSEIFPNNRKISGISLSKFQMMVENRFGAPLSEFKGEKFVYTPVKAKSRNSKKSFRSPASVEEAEQPNQTGNNTTMFWLMIILSVLGTSSYRIFNKKG